MQGKKRSKVGHLRAFLTRQAGVFCQKHRRKADCQHALVFRCVFPCVFCLLRRCAAVEAVAVEHAFSVVAAGAAVEQADAAMGAVVHFGVGEVQRTFAAGADAFADALPGEVVVEGAAAFGGGLRFFCAFAFEVAVHGGDGVAADEDGGEDADGVADVAAVAGQVGDEFDEEGEEGEVDEAPDKRPPARAAFFGEQPAGGQKQRQGEGEAVGEYLQLGAAVVGVFGFLRGLFQFVQTAFGTGGLPSVVEQILPQGIVPPLQCLLLRFEAVEFARAFDHFGVLFGLFGNGTGGQPVVQALLFGGGLRLLFVQFESGLIACVGEFGRFGLQAFFFGSQGLCAEAVGVVFQRAGFHRQRQIADDFAAQADKEGGEHQRDQPQAAPEPFFGQAAACGFLCCHFFIPD
nr:MAG TPA: hypothetical protein [Caudoviricetes sp.]